MIRRSAAWFLTVPMLLLAGCVRAPMKIGFSGPLTGKYSDLGVQGRNGVELGAEEINNAGGIHGRRIELLIRDDKGTADGAIAADTELIGEHVPVIIGHMTSAQSEAALPTVEKAGIILFSPTSSTPKLSGLRDSFFRIQPATDISAVMLARYVFDTASIRSIGTLRDTDNDAYTAEFCNRFTDEYTRLGGKVVSSRTVSSSESPDWNDVTTAFSADGAQSVLLVLSATDTAGFAQSARFLAWNFRLFSAGWAMTNELLMAGGRSVDGIVFSSSTTQEVETEKSPSAFERRYAERFGQKPSFAAIQSYDTMLILASALEHAGKSMKKLPEALTRRHELPGLSSAITIDEYGDTVSPVYFIEVRDARFVQVGVMNGTTR